MEDVIKVWTRQHKDVGRLLRQNGRHVVSSSEYISLDMPEHKDLIMICYDWLADNCPGREYKPADARYPVWVSLEKKTAYTEQKGCLLELDIPRERLVLLNIAKWSRILNYQYIPLDAADEKRHEELLAAYGISDARAVMERFYPQIRREVLDSWKRLFDPDVKLVNDLHYGLVWELRREWLVRED